MLPSTLSAKEVPALFHVPYITTGYRRQNQPWVYYVTSLFQRHNECMNIWTNIVAILLITKKMWDIGVEHDLFSDPYMTPLCVLFVTIMTMYLCSTLAHVFGDKSEAMHYTWFMIDYSGIGIYGFGGAIAHIFYCSDIFAFHELKGVDAFISAMFGINVCLSSCVAFTFYKFSHPYPSRLLKLSSVLFNYSWCVIPMIPRMVAAVESGDYDEPLCYHIQHILLFFMTAFFYSSDVPERFLLGECDFIGQSHNFGHIFVMLSTMTQLEAVKGDIVARKRDFISWTEPSCYVAYGSLALVVVINSAIVTIFKKYMETNILGKETKITRKPPQNNLAKNKHD